jgi:hypothetical protein
MWNSPNIDIIVSRENNKFPGQCNLQIQLSFSEKISPLNAMVSIPAATQSKRRFSFSSVVGIAESIPAGSWQSLSFDSCVLTGRDRCVGVIVRPTVPHQVWCVVVSNCEAVTLGRSYSVVEV